MRSAQWTLAIVAGGLGLAAPPALGEPLSGLVARIGECRPEMPEATRRVIARTIEREADRQGLETALVAAIAEVESRFDPAAVSAKGARGLLQLMPATEDEVRARLGEGRRGTIDGNVARGTRYFAELLGKFGRVDRALIAYNRGPSAARRAVTSGEERALLEGYPRQVLDARRRNLRRFGEGRDRQILHLRGGREAVSASGQGPNAGVISSTSNVFGIATDRWYCANPAQSPAAPHRKRRAAWTDGRRRRQRRRTGRGPRLA